MLVASATCTDTQPTATVHTPDINPLPPPTTLPTPALTAIPDNTTWILRSIDGRPITVPNFITVKIQPYELFGFDGCNGYDGRSEDGTPVIATDGSFYVPPIAITAMLCNDPEGVMELAGAYISTLTQGKKYRVTDERLEILDSDGSATLVFARQQPLEGRPIDLEGTARRLLIDEYPEGAPPTTLAVIDDRLVYSQTSCRPFLLGRVDIHCLIRSGLSSAFEREQPK